MSKVTTLRDWAIQILKGECGFLNTQLVAQVFPTGHRALDVKRWWYPMGVLWHIHKNVGLGHYWGFKILNFGAGGGGGQKNEYILRYEESVYIFWDHYKIWVLLGVIFIHLGAFLKVKLQNGIFLGGRSNFKYFWGMPDFPDIFGGINSRCWVQAYVSRKK